MKCSIFHKHFYTGIFIFSFVYKRRGGFKNTAYGQKQLIDYLLVTRKKLFSSKLNKFNKFFPRPFYTFVVAGLSLTYPGSSNAQSINFKARSVLVPLQGWGGKSILILNDVSCIN